MKLTVRNLDPTVSAMLKQKLRDMREKGIKINQDELVSNLLEKALTADFYDYKKDIYDKSIATLTDKFQEYIDSNNKIIEVVAGIDIEIEEDEEKENNEQD